MPVGNSLTAGKIPESGVEGDGFRGYLKDQLGADFTFVGGDITVTPGLNGHFQSGAKIESFLPPNGLPLYGAKDITVALTTYNPEIVLLHVGTNNAGDKSGPYTEQSTASYKLRELINTIGKHQSVGYILVCKIIPKLDANKNPLPWVQDYNEEIERMFFDNAISAKAVIVDLNSSVSNSELGIDGIHPVPSGYERMASEYARVIKAITNNPGDGTSPSAIRIDSAEPTVDPAISLKWYTPTDQGGIVNLYELRYLVDTEINSSNFTSGTIITLRRPGKNSPSSGLERTTIKEGILGGRTYNFAIRVYDQANNKSSISIFNPVVTPDVLPEPGIAFVDSFNNANLRGWNHDPAYQVANGKLRNNDAASGWNKLAILDSIKYTPAAEFVEVGARYALGNYTLGGLGLAMLLDSDDYRIANGYMIRLYGNIALYAIVNGKVVTGEAISYAQPSASPSYGDTLSVVYRNNPTLNSFEVKINGNSIGMVQDYQKRFGASGVLYSGVILYGALFNEVDSYSIKIPHLEPERMLAFGTTSISGEVDKTLGSALSVKVLDINGVGVANVPVDFNILSGVDAT
ncbi:hypothetical protein JW998_04025, partial [candidate division KSB1 bacterium]|nr:hypothetical protein [candidate division KSB1 bacterium]